MNSDCKLHVLERNEKGLTFTGDIIKYTYIKVFSISHFVTQDYLPLEVEYGDMGPIECDPGLVFPCSPSIEHARHGGRGSFIGNTKARDGVYSGECVWLDS